MNIIMYYQVLYIGSESYDGPTITVIEGLHKLGYIIYVYKKSNINSWFCNNIIKSISDIDGKIDFIVSNLHWGTRWDLYKEIKTKVPFILIDGDDHNNCRNWNEKIIRYNKCYGFMNPTQNEGIELLPHRKMIPIENYVPDIVFKSQKFTNEGIYIPFGITNNYLNFRKNIPISKRTIDICHFPGPGEYRSKMTCFINSQFKKYKVSNTHIYGNMVVDNSIKENCQKDKIHGWWRWKTNDKYFETINKSKICIYVPAPGGWDSKRPWEMISQGCVLLYFKTPGLIDDEYELKKLGDFFEFKNNDELIYKCNLLLNDSLFLEEKSKECYNNALKHFTSIPIAKYFLSKVLQIL